MLEVKDLTATITSSGKQILQGVNLVIREGEVHASEFHVMLQYPSEDHVWHLITHLPTPQLTA